MLDLLNENIFNVPCDVLVIPVSTAGTISNAFKTGLKQEIPLFSLPLKRFKLGDVEIFRDRRRDGKEVYIALACSVEDYSSTYATIRRIGKNLAIKILSFNDIKEITTPILGTGAGKLDPFYSRNILFNSFYEEIKAAPIRLTFSTPDKEIYYSFEGRSFDIDIPSGLLVIEAESLYISTNSIINQIQYSGEYYYELAEKKFQQFLLFETNTPIFYQKLLDDFKSSKLSFQDFFAKEGHSKQTFGFLTLCGELVAYIDYHAYRKNIWNKYKDKRVLARSTVRQNHWFENLLKYKATRSLNTVSASVKNAIRYLENPADNLTMLSKEHRVKVLKEILGINDPEGEQIFEILAALHNLGHTTKNSKNFGLLCSRILYLPNIKQIWLDTKPGKATKNDIIDLERSSDDLSFASILIELCIIEKSIKLDLGNCGITDLSLLPELFECTHLEELILSNEWPAYRGGKWTKAVSDNKGKKNKIKELPQELGTLINLKQLVCGGDWNDGMTEWTRWGISALSPIDNLIKLEHLNLSNNRLRSIKGLSKLRKLKTLHLNNNEIGSIDDLNELEELEEIFLSNNKISQVNVLNSLSAVKTIDLHNNKVSDLRPIERLIKAIGIANSKWRVNTINVAKNPLEYPAMEIVNIGKDAVLLNLEDIKVGGSHTNNEIKVILVGNSEVGKSTLAKYLDKEKQLLIPHSATLWMEEKVVNSKYKIGLGLQQKECVLHIFDFGGHDYYHDTHHLFYSNNTIYLLLWDKETNALTLRKTIQENHQKEKIEVEIQDYPIKYWLESVKYFTRDVEADNFEFEVHRDNTYHCSLLLLQNKVKNATKIHPLNNEKLWLNYPFIYDSINISIIDPRRSLNHFDEVFQEMLNCMKIVGAKLPKYYFTIKDHIQKYDGKPVLNFEEFLKYCNNLIVNPIDEEKAKVLVKYLKQIGVLLFIENTSGVKVYIRKSWIIDSIHRVLLNLNEFKGEFDKKYVSNCLGGAADDEVNSVLNMMLDFKMIFKHPFETKYIAPLYLPKMPEAKVSLFLNDKIKPHRRFIYTGYIHKNVVLNIFQQYGKLAAGTDSTISGDAFYYWKDGLVIRKPGTMEIVMLRFHLGDEEGNAYIDIFDVSNSGKNAVFINAVIEFIKHVSQGFEMEEMVTIDGQDFISVEVLEKNARMSKLVFTEKKISDFANGKIDEKTFKLKDYSKYMTTAIRAKKVVISYSKRDLPLVHTFMRYLRPLVDAGLIEPPWFCTFLFAAEEWQAKIKQKFDDADIVFFMVSEYFYSTQYILDHEIPETIGRYDSDNNSVKIVPIILEFYDWIRPGPHNLGRFTALPYQAKPISDYHNSKMAWHTITLSIKAMIEKELDPGKKDSMSRELQEIYERQVQGFLDKNPR